MKVEIWDSDPTSGCCCGPVMMSQQSIQRIMDSINEKNMILEKLRDEFKDVKLEVDTVSALHQPPQHRHHKAQQRAGPQVD
jgi:stress-induced morphogen